MTILHYSPYSTGNRICVGYPILPNSNEMDTNNMKSTWPMQELGRLGVALSRLGVALGRFGVALDPQGFLDTNMLV